MGLSYYISIKRDAILRRWYLLCGIGKSVLFTQTYIVHISKEPALHTVPSLFLTFTSLQYEATLRLTRFGGSAMIEQTGVRNQLLLVSSHDRDETGSGDGSNSISF